MIRLSLLLALFASPAVAQQQPPDPAALQRAINAVQQQRNQAMDLAAGAQVEVQRLAEENTKLKAEIEAMKKAATEK